MHILIIQLRKSPKKAVFEQEVFKRRLENTHIEFVNVFECDIKKYKDLSGINAVLVAGSDLVPQESFTQKKELKLLTQNAISKKVPFLGICFGHQWLLHVLGAKIARMNLEEEGLRRVYPTAAGKTSPLLRGLPDGFSVLQSHAWEVPRLPANVELLARGNRVRAQVVKLKNTPIYGVQFHPERTWADVAEMVECDILHDYAGQRANIGLRGKKQKEKIETTKILKNFVSIADSFV